MIWRSIRLILILVLLLCRLGRNYSVCLKIGLNVFLRCVIRDVLNGFRFCFMSKLFLVFMFVMIFWMVIVLKFICNIFVCCCVRRLMEFLKYLGLVVLDILCVIIGGGKVWWIGSLVIMWWLFLYFCLCRLFIKNLVMWRIFGVKCLRVLRCWISF